MAERLRPLDRVAHGAAIVVMALGALVLAGWWLHVPILTSLSPAWVSMKANTALAFLLGGMALRLIDPETPRRSTSRVGYACAWGAMAIGALTLSEYLMGWNLGIDQMLCADSYHAVGTSHPGRMAPQTAVSFMLGAASLLSLRPGARGARPWLAGGLGMVLVAFGLTAILGYVLRIPAGYAWGDLTRMALHTAVGFLLWGGSLCCRVFAARPSDADADAATPRSALGRFWVAGSLLVMTIALTVALSQYMTRQFRQQTQLIFDHQIDAVLENMQDNLRLTLEHLQGVVGLFAASKSVERDEFHTYVTRSQALAKLPGLVAVGYVERVAPEDRAAFEARVRADRSLAPEGYPAFAIHPDPQAGEEAYVVTYFEPHGPNQAVHGLDARADLAQGAALESAQDSGAAVVTEPVDLVQLTQDQRGLIFALPVYRNSAPQETVADRQAALAGFVVGVFKAQELFTRILDQAMDPLIDVEVFDGPVLTEEHVLFDRDPVLRIHEAHAPSSFHTIEVLPIGGRLWTVSLATRPGFGWDPVRAYLPAGLLVIGTFLGMLLAGIVLSLSFSRTQALRMAEDITKTLRDSEERYRQMVDSAPDPIIALSLTGFIDSVNPAAEQLSGFTREELIGKHLTATNILASSAVGPALKEFTLIVAGQARPPREYEMVTKEGRRLIMEAHGQALRAGQRLIGVQVIMRDVTLRRESEQLDLQQQQQALEKAQEITAHNEQLQRQEQVMHSLLEDMQTAQARLEAQDTLLRETNKRLQDMAALKDEFVAKVSHELRTPLTSIKEGLNLLMDNALGETNAEQQDFLKTMDQDIDRLTELINNMLDIAKIEGGGMRLRRDRLDLRDVALASSRTLQHLLGQRTLVMKVPEGLTVFGDENRLIQVLNNLLSNAVKFTPAEGQITVLGRQQDGLVSLAVRDTGTGILSEDLPKLFKKFSQVGAFDPNRPRGTGLGLVVCKELVEMHHGTIEASSEAGQGSAFTVHLPAYSDEIALTESFKDLSGPAATSGQAVALLAIDASQALGDAPADIEDSMLRSLAEDVRRHLHRGDVILTLGNQWVVVLAICTPDGPRAMVRRLRAAMVTYDLRYGAALHPEDGANAAAMFMHASTSLDTGAAELSREPLPERPS